jgi:hypothetical protein
LILFPSRLYKGVEKSLFQTSHMDDKRHFFKLSVFVSQNEHACVD